MNWDVLGTILGTAGSVAGGGIFGAVGALFSSGVKYFQQKQAHKIKKDEWAHEKDMAHLKMEAKSQDGSWNALKAGYEADVPLDNYLWVNAVKSLYRPVLTSALVFLTYKLFINILIALAGENVLSEIFTGTELKDILKYIVYSVVFSTTTAITWWFCERALSPPGMKNR